jgi:hypothetical protein
MNLIPHRFRVLLLVVPWFMSAAAHGQSPGVQYEKVLVPVFVHQPLAGAYGSFWTTELWLRNNGTQPVKIQYYEPCGPETCAIPEGCPPPPTPPSITFRPCIGQAPSGIFMLVERPFADQVSFGLRAQDISRQEQTRGTEVPVVRESEFRTDAIFLPDIPTAGNFRATLRIYGLDVARSADVSVRVYGIRHSLRYPFDPGGRAVQTDQLLGEATIRLQVARLLLFRPAFAEVNDFQAIAPLGGWDRVMLRVQATDPQYPIWAFASVIHNKTQHLTVISPQ